MNGERPSILVVEDDPDQGFIYEQYLGHEGFRVATATNAQQARDLLAEEPPDAVILDLSIDGLGLLGHIRAQDATRDVKVIVVSGRRIEEDEAHAHARWDHYLEKPTNLAELAELLRKQVGA